MKIGIYFCNCGPNIAGKIDADVVRRALEGIPGFGYFRTGDFLCSDTGRRFMEDDIRETRPDRVVVAACSVREHEETFRGILQRAGMNPYLLQMVNVREQVAWVTEDGGTATAKAIRYLRAAMARVRHHEPLERREIDIRTDVLVIGAGPAGLKAALALAEAGRRVALVEKGPLIGGTPVLTEELFPNVECGPCMMEPVQGELLHGPHADRVEILTLSEVTGVVGYYGNFTVTIRRSPRYVSPDLCIGCGVCASACPASGRNPFSLGLDERKGIDLPFRGALPNLPYIDPAICLRTTKGEACTLCRDACLVEGSVLYDDVEEVVQRDVGAILVATGAGLYDCTALPALGYGSLPDVLTNLEFERILAASGPTGGSIRCRDGRTPESVAIVHCVGSLDADHREYCSSVCCQGAFKFNHLVAHKLPEARVAHFLRTVAVPGKEAFRLYDEARRRPSTEMYGFDEIGQLSIRGCGEGRKMVSLKREGGQRVDRAFDMVVLCPALVPSEGTARVARLLELPTDRFGFIEELHGRMDASRTKVRGVFAAGACLSPTDIRGSVDQAMAAVGGILAGLVPGRKLAVEPETARVDPQACSRCRSCGTVCPYKAIAYDDDGRATVNDVLCAGCGTCAAACPSAAIRAAHFTGEEILAEIEEVLS